MGFWSDSSPVVKGAIIVGAIGIVVSLMVLFCIPPFSTDVDGETLGNQRGIQAGQQ
ncbi:MAG: hypothetical protein AAGF12_37435 [Myxococcota bacterium]